jgi:uncharacterized protein (DUF427 family)
MHPITVEPAKHRVTVRYGDRQVASTECALVLREAGHPPVHYLPLDDVDATILEPSDHTTYCPYKGDATYYSLHDGDRRAPDAVWSYRAPYEAVAEIAGHVAFYPEHVDIQLS